jgi:5-methylcytosine-specific restriction endonuclease McrA
MPDLRHNWAWRQLAARVITEEPICWLQLDDQCTIRSTTADHIIPVIDCPELQLERANLRGACHHCNSTRGARPVEQIHAEPPTVVDFFR